MKRILTPYRGLGPVKFDMDLREVQRIVGVKESEVTNKYLKETTVSADKLKYVFIKKVLTMIEMDYQDGIYLDGTDLFNTQDVDALLKGYEVQSRKDALHIEELGLVLFKFRLKDRKKRYLWCYSKKSRADYEHILEIV